ncbi:S8 family serine peptidase [Candidatus Peregrinibacteria bacterium]|nr:MAG: S8 family serine peptidase [Candidatus Peregrinibacteria bacterium]
MKKFIAFFSGVFLFAPFFAFAEQQEKFVTPAASFSATSVVAPESVPGEVLVRFKKNTKLKGESFQNRIDALAKKKSLKKGKVFQKEGIAVFRQEGKKTEEIISALQGDAEVESVQPNYIYQATAQTKFWNIGNDKNSGVNADLVWGDSTGAGVVVAIVDSGIDWDHPDLVANHWTNAGETNCTDGIDNDSNGYIDDCDGWDFIGSNYTTPADDNSPNDYYGHGTHVAGTVAEVNNTVGLVGVAPGASLMAVKALDDSGFGTTASIVDAVGYAVENGADVINMSLGASVGDSLLETAVNDAFSAGVVVVAAAGNSGGTSPHYPAAYTSVVAVGAVDSSNLLASFSSHGSWVDVVAPGVAIASTYPEHLTPPGYLPYAYMDGTSMATPHVSGLAALYLQAHPSATPTEVRDAIRAGTVDLGDPGVDTTFSYGLADAPSIVYGKAGAGDLVINELAWAGSSASTSDEWIEIRNVRNVPTNVGAFELTQSAGTETLMVKIPSGMIPANGYFLLSNNAKNYAFSGGESVLNVDPDVVNTDVSLSNTALQVKLYDGVFASGTLLDTAGDGNTPLVGSSVDPKATMSRKTIPSDGTLATNWFTSTTTGTNYDSGAIEKGTPKEANESDPVPLDVTPPVLSNGAPSGEFSAGTTGATLSLDTDEAATCKYDTVSGTDYASMPNTFTTTGGTSHSEDIAGLADGGSYSYYVRCEDTAGNNNPDDFSISFTVATATTLNGKVDLLIRNKISGKWIMKFTKSDLTGFDNAFTSTYSPDYEFYPADFSGDGKVDLLIRNKISGKWIMKFTKSDLTGFDNAFTSTYSPDYEFYPADFSGDGKVDLLIRNKISGKWIMKFTKSDLTGFDDVFTSTYSPDYEFYPADFSGDGKVDLLIRNKISGKWIMKFTKSDLTGFDNAFTSTYSPDYEFYPADFSGDGKVDLLIRNKISGKWLMKFTKSDLTGFDNAFTSTYSPDYEFYPADFSGDGKVDLLIRNKISGKWLMKFTKSDLTGFDDVFTSTYSPDYEFYPADFSGDGKVDLLIRNKISGKWLMKFTKSDLTGFDDVFTSTYSPDYEFYPADFSGE